MDAIIEQWKFPLGGNMATLTITGDAVEPEDIDALFEISLFFKQQVMKRAKESSARTDFPEYEI